MQAELQVEQSRRVESEKQLQEHLEDSNKKCRHHKTTPCPIISLDGAVAMSPASLLVIVFFVSHSPPLPAKCRLYVIVAGRCRLTSQKAASEAQVQALQLQLERCQAQLEQRDDEANQTSASMKADMIVAQQDVQMAQAELASVQERSAAQVVRH